MDVTTEGNDLAHVILRGGVDKYGTCIPNYHYEDCKRLLDMYAQKNLKNPAAIIDANHSNSNKQYKEQIRIVSEILHSRNYDEAEKNDQRCNDRKLHGRRKTEYLRKYDLR